MQRYRPVVHYWPDHNGLSQHAAAMREDSEDGAYYHRADVDAREAQWIAIDRAQKARIAELELSAQQSALERDCAVERVAEMEKALLEIAEECEYPACVLSPAEIATMARKSLMVRVTK